MKKILFPLFLFCAFFTFHVFGDEYKITDGEGYKYIPNDPFHTRIYTLDNGLTVYLLQNKSVPRIQTYIAVRAGAADESRESTGLAHYFEHMMFKGSSKIATLDWEKEKPLLDKIEDLFERHRKTADPDERAKLYKEIDALSQEAAKYSNNEYDELLGSIGARGTNAWTGFDETVYTNDIPVAQLEKFLILESERFTNIALRRFHTELETVYEEFNTRQDMDRINAYNAMLENMFPAHPYGRNIIGLPEHLKAPSMKDIHKFFEEYYTPDNIAVVISGDINYDETIALVKKYFGKLPKVSPKEHHSDRKIRETPITEPKIVTVSGPEKEFFYIAYRFDSTPKTVLMLDLISNILCNGKTGLIDVDIVQKQKLQGASAGLNEMREYSMLIFYGEPRTGQSLEEAQKLIFDEIEKLKSGDFDSNLIKATADNCRYGLIQMAENRQQAASQIVDSFINGYQFTDVLNFPDQIEKITKDDITAFAQTHLKNNYVLVNKLTGDATHKIKAEKPEITPVVIPNEKSQFAGFFESITVQEESEPEFVDFKTAMDQTEIKENLDFYYIPNKENERFTLRYLFPAGKLVALDLPIVFGYANLLGTDQYTRAELNYELYCKALDMGMGANDEQSYIEVSGLQRNFDDALRLMQHVIHNLKPDQEVYDKYVEDILKGRENARKSPASMRSGMLNYALYGSENPFRYELSEQELKAIKIESLTKKLPELLNMEHDILYYGPEKEDVIREKMVSVNKTDDSLRPFPEKKVFIPKIPNTNQVFALEFPGAQTILVILRPDTPFSTDKLAFANLFYPYAGAAVNAELRESRGLAYTAYTYYSLPAEKDKNKLAYTAGFIGCQPDKLRTSLDGLLALMDQVPPQEKLFMSAKEQVLQGIRSDRIQRESIYGFYKMMQRYNLDFDWRTITYADTEKMTLEQFNDLYKKHVTGKKNSICIIGNLDAIKSALGDDFGKVRILTLDEIF